MKVSEDTKLRIGLEGKEIALTRDGGVIFEPYESTTSFSDIETLIQHLKALQAAAEEKWGKR